MLYIIRSINVLVLSALALAGPLAWGQTAQFAVIGDYGVDNANELAVANRITTINPQFILTTGDNDYFTGSSAAADFANWDKTQGKYYAPFIKLPAGSSYGAGAATNNFYPVLGNHDWDEGTTSYANYFSNLPTNPSGNSRYYKFTRGPVEFFMLSSDPREPDGRSAGTTQYEWAKSAIQNSTAAWQIVSFHHPAWTYVTNHGAETIMRWPFASWGADAVFSGHNHNMEAMDVSGLPYFVMGSGGNSLYSISGGPSGATGLYSNDSTFGYALVNASPSSFTVSFQDTNGNTLYSQTVPEPAAAALVVMAVAGFLYRRR